MLTRRIAALAEASEAKRKYEELVAAEKPEVAKGVPNAVPTLLAELACVFESFEKGVQAFASSDAGAFRDGVKSFLDGFRQQLQPAAEAEALRAQAAYDGSRVAGDAPRNSTPDSTPDMDLDEDGLPSLTPDEEGSKYAEAEGMYDDKVEGRQVKIAAAFGGIL